MSLVHDALEKAKREAAAKSAREMGLAESRVGAGQPFRARRRIHPALAAGVAAAVTLGVVGALFVWSGAESSPSVPPAAPSTIAPPPATAAPESSAPTTPAPESAAASAPAAEITTPPAPTTSNEPTNPPTSGAPSGPAIAASAQPIAAPEPSPQSTRPPASVATAPEERAAASFVRQTTLADGTVVRLGGIAWSQEAPLAYLNGKLYAKGESVAGLLIERIERERVVLSGADGRIVLTLK